MIRTLNSLSDALADDLAWRKKELSSLRALIEDAGTRHDRASTLLRSGVALLYAHWEGFVRAGSRSYLEFVAFQRLPLNRLAANFLALSARKVFQEARTATKMNAHLALVRFFLNELAERSHVPYKDGVNTRSNLSSTILRDIIDTLGLDYKEFETKEKLLDSQLLYQRNTIAHGEKMLIDAKDYAVLQSEILGMMEMFRTQVENAAALRRYRLP